MQIPVNIQVLLLFCWVGEKLLAYQQIKSTIIHSTFFIISTATRNHYKIGSISQFKSLCNLYKSISICQYVHTQQIAQYLCDDIIFLLTRKPGTSAYDYPYFNMIISLREIVFYETLRLLRSLHLLKLLYINCSKTA